MYIHTDWWVMPQRIGDRVLLSTTEAVEISGLSRVHIQRLLRLEQIEGIKLGHDWLVFEDSLTKYTAEPRRPGPKSKDAGTPDTKEKIPHSTDALSSVKHPNADSISQTQSGKS